MEVEYLVAPKGKRKKKQKRKRANKVVFNITSKLDVERIEILQANIKNLKGKTVKKNDILNIEEIKLKVKSTEPDEEVIISKKTLVLFVRMTV